MPEQQRAHPYQWWLREAVDHYHAAEQLTPQAAAGDPEAISKLTRRLLAAGAAAQIATAMQNESRNP